jgi:hypothetical protein
VPDFELKQFLLFFVEVQHGWNVGGNLGNL